MQTLAQQFNALRQKYYDISMINQSSGKCLSDIRTLDTMKIKHPRYLDFNNNRNENIYIRAVPTASHNLLFLDDLNSEAISFLESKEYHPACVVESSKDNFQTWFLLPVIAVREKRKTLERVLIRALEDNGYSADHGSCDGGHYGRLVGFINHKPSRGGFIVRLASANGQQLNQEQYNYLVMKAGEFGYFNNTVPPVHSPGMVQGLEELETHEYTRPGVREVMRQLIASLHAAKSPSEQDWYLSCRLAKWGYVELDIAKALMEYGPNDLARKKDPVGYLITTASKAAVVAKNNF